MLADRKQHNVISIHKEETHQPPNQQVPIRPLEQIIREEKHQAVKEVGGEDITLLDPLPEGDRVSQAVLKPDIGYRLLVHLLNKINDTGI